MFVENLMEKASLQGKGFLCAASSKHIGIQDSPGLCKAAFSKGTTAVRDQILDSPIGLSSLADSRRNRQKLFRSALKKGAPRKHRDSVERYL